MRELKFRAWDKENECWLNFGYASIYRKEDGEPDTIFKFDFSDNYIVEQYTGLIDKNGKEIYEGDVVNIRDGVVFLDSMRNKHDNSFGIGEVMWNWGGFWVRPFGGGPCASLAEFIREKECCDCIEVIGNIHENPELLGGKE